MVSGDPRRGLCLLSAIWNDEGNPNEGDAILKRMLQMKPKPHKELIKKRHVGDAKRKQAA
jgi:hypothetical protein